MSTFCVEVDNDLIEAFPIYAADLGWTITGQGGGGSRSTFVEIDAPSAPPEIDGWLCSPAIVRRSEDATLFVADYGPLTQLRLFGAPREQRDVIADPGT